MRILGVSGSARYGGSVDRLVQAVLENIPEKSKEFVSLSDLQINPCQGCLQCVKTNRCVQKDDWQVVEEKIKQAEIMVMGVPTYYGAAFGINGITHNFLERWFSLRHRGVKSNLIKVIPAIVSGEGHGEVALQNLKTFFEMYHGIEVVDSIITGGITPCYVCGFGEECPMSAFLQKYGKGAKITRECIIPLEEQDNIRDKIKQICKNIN